MCGIVGYWNLGGPAIDPSAFQGMLDALTHRGPDDAGTWEDPGAGLCLGHRRLAILDLSAKGHQPMSNESGQIWITYNGEVYNFREIRQELVKFGHRFRSNSDTEVIIKAYEQWGMDCISRFRGMFAFALWDSRRRKLYLVRDRAGVKPLYYYRDSKLIVFGSEMRALALCPSLERRLDLSSLFHYMQFGYISPPRSIFEDVSVVRPGHYIEFGENGYRNEVKYWDIVEHYQRGIEMEASGYWAKRSEDEVLEEFEEILARGFKYRMVADVPVGIFLSSGIDSSIVAAVLAKKLGMDINTFTIGFTRKEFNEAEHAKEIATALGTNHRELYIDPETALDNVGRLPQIFDEPFGDNSGIPTYLVSQMARENVKVALSADAGDELFAGYYRYFAAGRYRRFLDRTPALVSNLSRTLLDVLPASMIDAAYSAMTMGRHKLAGFQDKLLKAKRMLAHKDQALLYEAATSDWYGDDLRSLLPGSPPENEDIPHVFDALKGADFITKMMCLDFKKYMVDDVLTKVDRASMAVSLEAREPFLDHDLVEYAATLPLRYKYRAGESKYLLKRVLYKYLPESMFQRPKQGFAAPIGEWLRGPLRPLVERQLSPEAVRGDAIFDPQAVSQSLARFYGNKSVSANQIWYLLEFQMWKEQWWRDDLQSSAPEAPHYKAS